MHIIEKLTFEVHYRGRHDEGFELQQQTTSFCHDKLMPALEACLDRLVGSDTWLVLDRLEVDVGQLDDLTDLSQMEAAIISALEEAILRQTQATAYELNSFNSIQDRLFDKWLRLP